MRRILGVAVLAIALCATHLSGQEKHQSKHSAPLLLTGAIPLPNVHGRIDHFGFDPNNRLFVSVLGSNTEEVIDLSAQSVIHSITGIPAPQGVVYSPEANKLFVASTKGRVYIYDGTSLDLITSIDFHTDADNLRYEVADKRVYVGYGENETGAIGMTYELLEQLICGRPSWHQGLRFHKPAIVPAREYHRRNLSNS